VNLSVPSGSGEIELFQDAQATQPLATTSWQLGSQPSKFWLLATSPSASLADIELLAQLTVSGTTSQTVADSANLTAIKVQFVPFLENDPSLAQSQPVAIARLAVPLGFDAVSGQGNKITKWLMVPQTQTPPIPLANIPGKNSLKAVVTPAAAEPFVTFTSSIPANAKVDTIQALPADPNYPGAAVDEVTVEGLIKSETAILRAVPKAAQQPKQNQIYDSVNLDVRVPKTVTVSLFNGADANDIQVPLAPPLIPTLAQVNGYFQETFTEQAAITANASLIAQPNQPTWDSSVPLTGIFQEYDGTAADDAEYNALISAPAIANDTGQFKVVFVDKINAPAAATADTLGFTVDGTNIAIVATYDSNGNPLPVAEVLAIAAHELGHMMGLESPQYPNDGHNSLPNHLMTASLANNPTFLYTLSQYEWDALNP